MFRTRGLFVFVTGCWIAASTSVLPQQAAAAITDGTQVTVNTTGTYGHVGGGGEFNVISSGNPSFLTFCLEYNESISVPGTYYSSVDNGAVKGGQSGQTLANYDPLSKATQWFYAEFVNNRLGTDTGLFLYNNSNWASALQLVIWRLEGEATVTGSGTSAKWQDYNHTTVFAYYSSVNNSLYQDATQLWTWYTNHAATVDQGNANVFALNLWKYDLTDAQYASLDGGVTSSSILYKVVQSQLYYNPPPEQTPTFAVPAPATFALWSGLGGIGLAFGRFRNRRRILA